KFKLEKAQAKASLLKAQPSFLNVHHITELLVKSMKPELAQLPTNHDFSASIPIKLKELTYKVNTILLNKVVEALDRFANAIELTSQKASDQGVPLVGPTSTHPAKGEKNTRQPMNTQLFQRIHETDVANVNLNKETMIPETITFIPIFITKKTALIIPTTLSFRYSFISIPPNTTPQLGGASSLFETSKQKPLKRFTYINEKGETFQMTQEEIENQKGIKQAEKADVVKSEIKKGKALGKITNYNVLSRGKGPITLKVYMDDGLREIIQKFKASDLHLGEWKEVMDACHKRTGAGWTTIFTQMRQRLDALHKAKIKIEVDLTKPLEEQDQILKLNVLAKYKRNNVDDLHDYFKSTKRYNKLV
nr:hypothetical protein [Tanacetum cinerariifolium]